MSEPARSPRKEQNVTPLGSALAIRPEQEQFNRAQVEALKRMNGWDSVPHAELSVFFHQAQRTGLDPFARQIYLIGRRNNRANRTDYTIQTSIDGMRLVADRTGRYAGSDRPKYGEDNGDKYAEVAVWKIVGGTRVAFTGVAYEAEFRQDRSPMWQKMPRTMLAKCAEAQALRKAFPADLSGIYGNEEMDQAGLGEATVHAAGEITTVEPHCEPEMEGQVVEDAEVVEESPGRSDDHEATLKLVGEVYHRIPEEERPNKREVWNFAKESAESARKALSRLETLADKSGSAKPAQGSSDGVKETVESWSGGDGDPNPADIAGVPRGGAAKKERKDQGELPATKKQLNFLEALIEDAVDDDGGTDWTAKFEEMVGKPLNELTREEASEWISRLSGGSA